MKTLHNLFLFSLLILVASGCGDRKSVFDQNVEIEHHNWSYVNKVKFDVKIDDAEIPYNLYFNLRVTGDYKYANIFVLFQRSGPGLHPATTRYEIKLANPDGEWLGKGTGNLYSYQVPFRTGFRFPSKGVYHFEFEQNMRDNPLAEVSDAGMRVEKGN
jgi:gliding motility-associated lipoprotein GldH